MLIFCYDAGSKLPVAWKTIFPAGKGGNPIAGGKRRRKFTAFDLETTPPTLVRRDYALQILRADGAKLPELYFDELGNMRGAKDELVMAGPRMQGE